MFVNSDFSELLRLFNAGKVRYLIVGGYAVVQYTEPRFTADLDDVWTGTDARNARAVYGALREFGAPLSGSTPNLTTSRNRATSRCVHRWEFVPPVRVRSHAASAMYASWAFLGPESNSNRHGDDGWRSTSTVCSCSSVHLTRRPHFGKAGFRSAAGHD